MSQLPQLTELLEAGVHFGHHPKRCNPKMKPFIYTTRNGVNIMDLSQTMEGLEKATEFLKTIVGKGRIIFVGTKRQIHDILESESQRAGELYVVNRWVGGLLTNFNITQASVKKMLYLDQALNTGAIENRTKRELLLMRRDLVRLQRLYWGIRDMKELPVALVIIDPNQEKIAVKEASALGIPTVAIVDTNGDPEVITYPVVGNDDAINSVSLFVKVFVDTILDTKEDNKKKVPEQVKK